MAEAKGITRSGVSRDPAGVVRTDSAETEIPKDSENGFPLLRTSEEYHNLNDLVSTCSLKDSLEEIISENKSAKKLLSCGLRPANRILFCGPPGTGKTLSAKILSSVMGYPLVYVTFDSVISSYLGETATNLRKIFEYIENGRYVVLFDEFDIVGKKRDDPHEHGEIKRVVNNFMQMLDTTVTLSIIIAATNHQQLLDTAVWRRFDSVLYFDLPDLRRRRDLFKKYLGVVRCSRDISLDQLARRTAGNSAADIAHMCRTAMKRCIINGEEVVTGDHMAHAISAQASRKKAVVSD